MDSASEIGLGYGAFGILSIYMLANLLIGVFAHRAGTRWTARDYFLGGKTTGALVLFFAMLATKFSGNTFFGLPGQSYRTGLMAVMLVPFLIAITVGFLAYAPRLYVLSRKYDYLTPADYYADRFQSRRLRLFVAVFFIITVIPYLMIQTAGMGHAFVGFSGGQIPFAAGVIYVSAVLLGYVLLGGWRGVVWAEVLQGSLLLGAIIVAAVVLVGAEGGVVSVIQRAGQTTPQKILMTDSVSELMRSHFLYALVFAFGGSMYPQIIQSVYAAKTETDLRRSVGMMVPNYVIIMLCVVAIGMVGIVSFPSLGDIRSDQILGLLLGRQTDQIYWVVVLVFIGAAAAIMSTAAGVLLTLSSMVTHDLYRHFLRPSATEEQLAWASRVGTVVLIVGVTLASLQPIATLWQLTIIKFELLMQLYVPMILGLYWPRFSTNAAFVGVISGTLVVLGMTLVGRESLWLFGPGLLGFLANATASIAVSFVSKQSAVERKRIDDRFFSIFLLHRPKNDDGKPSRGPVS